MATKKKAMKKVAKEEIITGKTDQPTKRKGVTSLDQLFKRQFTGYKTGTAEEYNESISKASLADLRRECIERGVLPYTSNKSFLVKELNKKFKQSMNRVESASRMRPVRIKSDKASQIMASFGNS